MDVVNDLRPNENASHEIRIYQTPGNQVVIAINRRGSGCLLRLRLTLPPGPAPDTPAAPETILVEYVRDPQEVV